MFTLSDLKKTRVYREAKLEGEEIGVHRGQILGQQQGQQQGLKGAAVRLLTRKLGKVSLKTLKRLDKLSAEQLEDLAEAVLDFEKVADLDLWLKGR